MKDTHPLYSLLHSYNRPRSFAKPIGTTTVRSHTPEPTGWESGARTPSSPPGLRLGGPIGALVPRDKDGDHDGAALSHKPTGAGVRGSAHSLSDATYGSVAARWNRQRQACDEKRRRDPEPRCAAKDTVAPGVNPVH